jgi:hypothetical protein
MTKTKRLFKPNELVNINTSDIGAQVKIVKDTGGVWVSVEILPSYTKARIHRGELTRIRKY